tara:strand:+ start:86925 stop:87050 length:126 start_codon:yes stop_codon:yes gene_type:complete
MAESGPGLGSFKMLSLMRSISQLQQDRAENTLHCKVIDFRI